jgi:hypothetical protein
VDLRWGAKGKKKRRGLRHAEEFALEKVDAICVKPLHLLDRPRPFGDGADAAGAAEIHHHANEIPL